MLDQSRPETQVIVVAPANDRTCCGRNGTGVYPVLDGPRIIATAHPRFGWRPEAYSTCELQHRLGVAWHFDAAPFANERPLAVDDEGAALDAPDLLAARRPHSRRPAAAGRYVRPFGLVVLPNSYVEPDSVRSLRLVVMPTADDQGIARNADRALASCPTAENLCILSR